MSYSPEKLRTTGDILLRASELSNQPDFPQPFLEGVNPAIIRLIAASINTPDHPIDLATTSFRTVYAYQFRTRRNLVKDRFLLGLPDYSVTVSDNLKNHRYGVQAERIVANLCQIRDPWSGLEEAVQAATIQLTDTDKEFLGKPPVVVIVASEQDIPPDPDGFQHGQHVSVFADGSQLGICRQPKADLPMTVIFGSRAWEIGFGADSAPQTLLTVQHELCHLLTLMSLFGKSLYQGDHLGKPIKINALLGYPLWEGLADNISELLPFIGNEEEAITRGWYKLPGESSLRTKYKQFGRLLGNVPVLSNTLYTGLLLRLWQGEQIRDIVYDNMKSYTAACRFLHQCNNGWIIQDKADSIGCLAKEIFASSGFDWFDALKTINGFTQKDMARICAPLNRLGSSVLYEDLLREFAENKNCWDPFGKDTLH